MPGILFCPFRCRKHNIYFRSCVIIIYNSCKFSEFPRTPAHISSPLVLGIRAVYGVLLF